MFFVNKHPTVLLNLLLGFWSLLSQEEINAEKRRAEDELKKSRIIILPDEIAPNANMRKVDIEAVCIGQRFSSFQ